MGKKDKSIKTVDGRRNNSVSEILPQRMMTVRQMGDLLGLKKTDRYWLVHKGFFKTEEIQGQILIDMDSFEKWYKNQLTYHKVNGEVPGLEIIEGTYSISEAAALLHVTESTIYVILRDTEIPTVEIDHQKRIPKDVFDEWYVEQLFCKDIKKTQNPIRTALLRKSAVKYISVKDASQIVGISRQALIKHLDKGHMDYVRFGRDIRINRESFTEWLNSERVSSI